MRILDQVPTVFESDSLKKPGITISFFLLLSFFPSLLFAQGEANNWFFGSKNGMTFNSGPPQTISCPHNLNGGTAVASDSAGNLLFYTDGDKVFTKTHQVMENGTGLLGWGGQTCITFPVPGSKKFYYIFTVGRRGTAFQPGLRSNMIDMEANGGEGKVIQKNLHVPLGDDAMYAITATFHRYNKDIWLIARKQDSTSYTYASYLITASGIANPVLYVHPKPFGNGIWDNDGPMRVSPDGKKFIDAIEAFEIYCHFNNLTGVITPICKLFYPEYHNEIQQFGMEYSPSSKYMYLCGSGNTLLGQCCFYVYQYDVSGNDSLSFLQSMTIVGKIQKTSGEVGLFGMMLAAPDGKIYGIRYDQPKLFTINRPDLQDTACNFQHDGFDLTSANYWELPQFLTSYIQRFFYTGSCMGTPYTFTSNFQPVPDSIHWDFGDGATSSQLNPTHIFTTSGTFTVVVNVRFPDGRAGEAQREINVAGLPHPDLGPDLTVCKGTNVQLTPGTFASYSWKTGETAAILNTADTGYYQVQVVNDTGCINSDTIHVAWFRQPVLNETNLNIAPTTCNSSTGAITGIVVDGLQPVTYTWKNGSGTILGNEPDLFHLPVDNYTLWVRDSAGCDTPVKTYTIKNVGDSLILSVDHADAHCNRPDGYIRVNATAGLTNMLLYAIDTSYFLPNQGLFNSLPAGSYQVWVKDSLGCKKVYDGNPVVIHNSPGPRVMSPDIHDETNGQADGSITILPVNPPDSLWYSIGGGSQLNNGFFPGLSAGAYSCTVTDKYGCDTTLTVILKNVPKIRLEAIAGDGSACLGNVAVLPLLANHFSHVGSFSTQLKYNKTLVTCQNYLNANPALADSLVVDLYPSLGELSIGWTGKNPVNLQDGSTLVELSFASLMTGQDSLKWDIAPGICTFLDSLGNTIQPEYKQGQMRIYTLPQGSISAPAAICEGGDLSLTGIYTPGSGNGSIHYQWTGPGGLSVQDTAVSISPVTRLNSGEYTLSLSDTNHCQSEYTVQVNVVPLPVSCFLTDTVYFDGQTRLEAAEGYFQYAWNSGDSTSSILVDSEGWYKVTMKTPEGCTATDSVMMLYSIVPLNMPNAFTPNGDGKNEEFRPVTLPEKISSFSMLIYNRWGQLVFSTNDVGRGWDGRVNGSSAPMGVYTYTLTYGNPKGEKRKKTGVVALIR